jgi:antitoxin (DNA-binding transcriptional repressor) of toxin-antitoxin stability system
MSTTLTVAEAQEKLAQLLELARAGHEVFIQDPQRGKARLVPVPPPAVSGPRRFGLHGPGKGSPRRMDKARFPWNWSKRVVMVDSCPV